MVRGLASARRRHRRERVDYARWYHTIPAPEEECLSGSRRVREAPVHPRKGGQGKGDVTRMGEICGGGGKDGWDGYGRADRTGVWRSCGQPSQARRHAPARARTHEELQQSMPEDASRRLLPSAASRDGWITGPRKINSNLTHRHASPHYRRRRYILAVHHFLALAKSTRALWDDSSLGRASVPIRAPPCRRLCVHADRLTHPMARFAHLHCSQTTRAPWNQA